MEDNTPEVTEETDETVTVNPVIVGVGVALAAVGSFVVVKKTIGLTQRTKRTIAAVKADRDAAKAEKSSTAVPTETPKSK